MPYILKLVLIFAFMLSIPFWVGLGVFGGNVRQAFAYCRTWLAVVGGMALIAVVLALIFGGINPAP